MEKIDLTKCVNLRYMARIGEHHVVGRIGFDENGTIVLLHNGLEPWRGNSLEEIMKIYGMENFEIIPRDPETYQDWQVGDVIGSIDEYGKIDDVVDDQCRVIFRSGELVAIAENYEDADINGCYTCSQLFREGWRLVLTDIEEQIIEEKKKYEPQDGDVCFVKTAAGNGFIFIKRDHKPDDGIYGYAIVEPNIRFLSTAKVSCVCDGESIREIRPAAEDERRQLFDAMAKEGKRWNAERKVVEDIPKPHVFRKGEPVLVRDYDDNIWKLAAFRQRSGNASYPYAIWNERGNYSNYRLCIPYNERTMHLLGTTEDYKEEQL